MPVRTGALQGLIDLLFPTPAGCVLCGEPVAGLRTPLLPRRADAPGGPFCPACLQAVLLPPEGGCVRCGRPDPGPDRLCRQCWYACPPFHRARAVGIYAGPLQEAILRFKSRGESWLAEPLGGLLAWRLRCDFFPPDLVVPVPPHPRKLRARGYNQAELLARAVCRRLGLPLAVGVLDRQPGLPPQAGLDSAERERNAGAAFRLAPAGRTAVAGKTVLLIDDILTTGNTAGACAGTLLAGGARKVDVLVLAVAPPSGRAAGSPADPVEGWRGWTS